jgi:hypothetical protein
MDDVRFDLLTRRIVLGGIAGGSLAALLGHDDGDAKGKGQGKRKGKRKGQGTAKRCRQQKRAFCAGRCCPKGRRCLNGACVQSCDEPFSCSVGGGSCGGRDDCFCSTDVTGGAACVAAAEGVLCSGFPACGAGIPCPSGLICGSCTCFVDDLDFRCLPPCPAG